MGLWGHKMKITWNQLKYIAVLNLLKSKELFSGRTTFSSDSTTQLYLHLQFFYSQCLFGEIIASPMTHFLNLSFLHYYLWLFCVKKTTDADADTDVFTTHISVNFASR